MKLSVIILNYNVRYFLELCLLSVERAIKNIDAEIIVIDNKSSDESCTMIKNNFPKVILIQNNENLGFSVGNNIGVKKAKGEYLCILNPDTVVAEDTFVNLLLFADGHKNIGVLGCKMIDGTGQYLPESKRNIPTPLVSFKKILGYSNSYYANHIEINKKAKVDILSGAFMLLKKDIYEEVKGFDEDYFMYGEDVDLSYKINLKGYQNYYVGSEKIIHFKGESTMKDAIYRQRFYEAMKLFYKKHFKSNFLFDSLIYFGIHLAKFLNKKNKIQDLKPKFQVLISDKAYAKLNHFFENELIQKENLKTKIRNSKIIIDTDYFDFKSIINTLSQSDISDKNMFRFLIKKSAFFVGSDSSKSKGEVVQL